MLEKLPPHQKVRFRRNEIGSLDSLPSAVAGRAVPQRPTVRRRLLRPAIAIGAVVVLAVAIAGFAGLRLYGGEALRAQAAQALSAIAGRDVEVRFGAAGLGLAGASLISFDIAEAEIGEADGKPLLRAGSLSFGLRLLPLLSGDPQLSSAALSDARVDLPLTLGSATSLPLPELFDEEGLLDPEKLGDVLFAALGAAFDALAAGQTETLILERVQIAFGTGEEAFTVAVADARLERRGDRMLAVRASLELEGRRMELAAEAERDPIDGTIGRFRADATAGAIPAGAAGLWAEEVGRLRVRLGGGESPDGARRLTAEAAIDDLRLKLRESGDGLFAVEARATLDPSAGQLDLEMLEVTSGQSSWRFAGSVEPVRTGTPRYAFQLAADAARVAPAGSAEAPVEVAALLGGSVDREFERLTADLLRIETEGGIVEGRAAVLLDGTRIPGLELSLAVRGTSTAEVKQLWPWFAAREAREWVHENLSGGEVAEGLIELAVPPGRLASGVPLGADEVSGRFSVSGVTLQVTGEIPAVEGAAGEVAFAGSDVAVKLSGGRARLPSGAELAIGEGSFEVRDAHVPDAVGQLEIDISGMAAAVVELVGLKPIDASHHLDLAAEEVSGEVRGKFLAEIPLSGEFSRDAFDWMAMLDFSGLALAQPFKGHRIQEGEGSILAESERIVVDSHLLLDGMRARVHLVEPLGPGEKSSQQVELVVDDAARERLMPGLGTILSGSAAVQLSAAGEGRREIEVDLAGATVNLPWMGWSKGTGIPARASFVMATSEGATRLDEFSMRGDSFSVTGKLSLSAAGGLASANFDRVRLNRNDDFSVNVGRAGGGYRVEVSGQALDARPLIRQLTADSASAASSVESVPVVVELNLGRIVGFHDEVLHDVRLSYAGTGTRVEQLNLEARTASGQPVVFRQSTASGRRSIGMQSSDAGAVLRFLDLYDKMEGGRIDLALGAGIDRPLTGHLDARDFWIVGEPRLESLVSKQPQGGDRSLNQAISQEIDVSRAFFDRGFALIEKGEGWLTLDQGVLRGPAIGSTFRGILFDRAGNMDMSGTFMPAYGINRLFGEIPLFGHILGNGRDGGLIGITFRLAGRAAEPQLQINPLSAIAPGIFRSVFEFR